MVYADDIGCNKNHGVNDEGRSFFGDLLSLAAIAAAAYNSVKAVQIADDEWEMAKKYWQISKNWLDYYKDNYAPVEDQELEEGLLKDEKELAEHNMLVDLGRNDIGRISKIGTVEVEKYMSIEHFSQVMHIGSTVAGELREDKDAVDAVDSILPAGTLSGAPKFRACQIIEELEQSKRGIYGGAIGYLDFAGNLDTCIAIRLVYKKNGEICIRSGAGIVADSVPEKEFDECCNKARAVVLAIEKSQEGLE